MQIGALIALLRAVTLPFLASISAVFESRLARSLRAAVAIRAPICLTQTSEFLSLMNPLLTQMLGESASVEIQASVLERGVGPDLDGQSSAKMWLPQVPRANVQRRSLKLSHQLRIFSRQHPRAVAHEYVQVLPEIIRRARGNNRDRTLVVHFCLRWSARIN